MHPADESPRWRRSVFFWRRNVPQEIDAELHFHFQSRVEELVAQGVTIDVAHKQAIEEFGDVTAVRRDLHEIDRRIAKRERRSEWLADCRRDLAYAMRSLGRAPAVAVTVVVTLALGLGVNAAIFSVLNAVFLRPPAGVTRPEAVRRVWTEIAFRSGRQFWSGYDYQEYETVRQAVASLASATVYAESDGRLGRGAAAAPIRTVFASRDYFRLLGVRPALGRFFSPDEDRLGAELKVAVASHAFWSRALGSDSAAIGTTLVLNGEPHTLVGVAAPAFHGVDLNAADLWVPLASQRSGRTAWWLNPNENAFQILMRLTDSATPAEAEARAALALRQLAVARGARDTAVVVRTGSIIRARGPGRLAQEVQVATRLGGVALVVLMIACANVVNLLLARAVRRRREIAMRLALGISRARLARLVLSESVLLALAAGVTALVAAHWGGLALRALLLPDVKWAESPVDWRVLVIALLATSTAGLVSGAVPALQSASTELTDVLKSGPREGHLGRSRLRSLLVSVQAALSVVLLVGAALFLRSLANVRALDLGFDSRDLLFGSVTFDMRDAHRDSLTPMRMAEVAGQLRGAAGAEGVAQAQWRPLSGFSTTAYFPDVDTLRNRKPEGFYWGVSPEYFATAGTRILAGSGFPRGGTRSEPTVIVNAAMAEALWPGQSPLGRCIRFREASAPCYSVAGVVETAHWGRIVEEATPQFYLPLDNMPFPIRSERVIAVRVSRSRAMVAAAALRRAIEDAFPGGVPVVERMSAVLEPHYRPWRLGATLFTLFGVLAAVVAAVGVYSTVSYTVTQRTQEFGVRIALGARWSDVVRYVLRDGLRTVIVGVVAGVALSMAAGPLVASLLYGISPYDPVAITGVVLLLTLVTAVAALAPAWRAAQVDPITAMRAE